MGLKQMQNTAYVSIKRLFIKNVFFTVANYSLLILLTAKYFVCCIGI